MVSGFELISRIGLDFLAETMPEVESPLAGNPDWMVLIDIGLPAGFGTAADHLWTLFEAAVGAGLSDDGVIASSEAQRASPVAHPRIDPRRQPPHRRGLQP